MSFTKSDLDAARAEGVIVGLEMAAVIAEAERTDAKTEEEYRLSSSVRERTEVRRKYAEVIARKIRKQIAKLSV